MAVKRKFSIFRKYIITKKSATQAVLFDKEKWTVSAAKAWLKEHKHKSSDMRETEDKYRFEQIPSEDFSRIYETRNLGKGIQLINGILKVKKRYDLGIDKIEISKPKIKPGESEKEWMARCIPYVINEGRKKDQATAICASMWREKVEKTVFSDNDKVLWKIRFNNSKFTRKQAVAWCKNNGYSPYDVIETEDEIIVNQRWSGDFEKGTEFIDEKEHGKGITFVYGTLINSFEILGKFILQNEYKAPEDVVFDDVTIEKGQDLRLVTGIVLEPETVDAQGDIYSEEEVRKTAHEFLAEYSGNGNNLMHKVSNRNLKMVESYILPVDMEINEKKVKKGTWMMSTLVLDDQVWKAIKDKKITGYSIEGVSNAKSET